MQQRGSIMANKAVAKMKLPRFRVITRSETFEADYFDWGRKNKKGEQYLSFFIDGNCICYVLIDEVCEIKNLSFVDTAKEG
jgi:hypothetical protein